MKVPDIFPKNDDSIRPEIDANHRRARILAGDHDDGSIVDVVEDTVTSAARALDADEPDEQDALAQRRQANEVAERGSNELPT